MAATRTSFCVAGVLGRLSALAMLIGLYSSVAIAQGTVTVPLSNDTPSCINAATRTIDFWLLSARIPKKQTWLTDTNGVGARVDVQISGGGQKVSFPAAKSISTTDQNGKIIRASLSLHILADQDLWNPTDAAAPIKTSNIDVPVTFVRRQGSSDTVKVFQALLSYTDTAGASLPPNPYVKGAEMVGQLASSLLTVFQPDPNAVVDPNFALSFGISRADSGCRPKELQQGVGAQIADSDLGDESTGIIRIARMADYCFYKLGQDGDPDIGFSRRGNGPCTKTVPANVQTLNNPQFIWMAYGTCKPDKTCSQAAAVPAGVAATLSTLSQSSAEFSMLLADRLGPVDLHSTTQPTRGPAARAASINRAKTAVRGLELCKSVGISEERCLSKKL